MPGMWKAIDRLNASERAGEEELARRRKRGKVYGVLLLILGVLLLVPGVMAPGEMALQLIAGLRRHRRRCAVPVPARQTQK